MYTSIVACNKEKVMHNIHKLYSHVVGIKSQVLLSANVKHNLICRGKIKHSSFNIMIQHISILHYNKI